MRGFQRRRREQRPPLYTDGCEARPNDVLTALARRIEANTTPVRLTRQLRRA